MTSSAKQIGLHGGILAAGVIAPFAFPDYTFQISVLWLMIVFALTWDIMGGQMGYNSLGNIFFFGAGMYVCTIVQIGLFYDVAEYTAHFGAVRVDFTADQYFTIGTLGVAIAAGELVGAWDYVGGGGGVSLPNYPGEPDDRAFFFYVLCFGLAVATFAFLKWLYGTRFGLAINAIRDDEEKAEAMGLRTKRYKTVAWSIAAFFLGISGGLFGNMTGFIEPLEVAFPTVTFGIFMVLMALLGGKGTLWGPVLGATVFHIVKEVTWTYLLGWQWVALGLLIIINVVYFQQGILGWAQEKWPERFGITVDEDMSAASGDRRARAEAAE